MRRQVGTSFLIVVWVAAVAAVSGVPSLSKRKEARLSTYSPPVIPHEVDAEIVCVSCHLENNSGVPTMPHKEISNCRQCHVPQQEIKPFRKNRFRGEGDPQRVKRAKLGSPPTLPHRIFMRENCLACHGPEARSDIVHTPHPERGRCLQCHVEQDFSAAKFR